jgi:hypothetical protein
MAAYDHWLWRLFFWWCGYRWYWITHPNQPITAEAVGRLVRHKEKVWRLVELSHHRTPYAYVILPKIAQDVPWISCNPAVRDLCRVHELVLVSHVLMPKRLHDFVCCEGWAADLEACYSVWRD